MKRTAEILIVEKEFKLWKKDNLHHIEALNSGSGSNRQYFRLTYQDDTFIATINKDIRENEAFFYLATYYRERNIRVPEVLFISNDKAIYFQADLGDVNLLSLVKNDGFSENTLQLYKDSLRMLWQMQFAGKDIDYSKCYPRPAFDKQSVLWDLNYFKYYFLKVSGIEFDEQLLEDDLQRLASYLEVGDENYFMFRDFQARNIQIHQNEVWFIDFQGGRRGPLLYDAASILFQASANIYTAHRQLLLDYYYQLISKEIEYPRKQFDQDFHMMVFVRIIQTLGAYGFRGLIEGKEYFRNSIPNALENLKWILPKVNPSVNISFFLTTLERLVEIKDKFDG